MAKKYKILIVEDEPDLLEIYEAKIKQSGFEVETEADGANTIAKIKQCRPDLILLDLIIPHVDGYEILAQMKKDKNLKNFKVVAWSNLTQKDEIEKAQKLGVDEYWIKSDFTPTKLVEKINDFLKIKD